MTSVSMSMYKNVTNAYLMRINQPLYTYLLYFVDQLLQGCLIAMSGDADHIVRMKVANTMSTLYGVGRVNMSCEQQGAIYLQVTNTLQNISSLNVSHYCPFAMN